MNKVVQSAVLAVGLTVRVVFAADAPHIAYVFPAGGQQGQLFDVEIGGQYLEKTTNVFVTGEGVSARIEKFTVKIDKRRLGQIYNQLKNLNGGLVDKEGKALETAKKRIAQLEKQLMDLDLPPDVDFLDRKAVQRMLYKNDQKEQFNPQIADRLRVKVSVAENAPPGERELRVYTPQGLSNPIYFQVGSLEEIRETEPNDDHMSPDLQMVSVPCVINGQVRPGDMDHFRFNASRGDSIVVDVGARRIIPYLADAVPGWFQAVVALYDQDGKEVAYQDDYKFNPDPVLFFDVPATGNYTLSIHDSIYRGREDFIYRIAIGELPFITGIFPLGAREGNEVDIALSGRNLPKTRLIGTLPEDGFELRHISVRKKGYRSNQMPFAIGEMDEIFEAEPNDLAGEAQPVMHPLIINGRIGQVGDRDVFSFQGARGDSVSIEVIARRLNSPLDSNIILTGPGIDKPIRNDDLNEKDKTHLHLGAGLITHHADSYLLHELPSAGTYFVEIADAQNKGGHDYAYRLRISHSNPDFKLRMEPSGLQISPGGTAAFTVRALRQDGYQKKITLEATNLPDGFIMSEAIIPNGSDMTRFTITAPGKIERGLVSPQINGTGMINGKSVIRPAVPVDDQMQAFLYRHLVPAKELVLAPVSKRPPISFQARIPKSGLIEMQAGKDTRVILDGQIPSGGPRGYSVKLDHPPEGFSTVKNGWIGKQKRKEKDKNGNARFMKNKAVGSILISVDESVEPGTRLSLVLEAEVRNGKDKTYFPAPAIPLKVVKIKK